MRTLLVHPVALTTAVALTLVVAGCVPAATPADPAPNLTQPSTEPLFASEEEALAAAEEAYAAYLAMASAISADGGRNPERIEPFVTERYLREELDSAARLQASGLRIVGVPAIETFTLQFFSYPELAAYVCQEISEVRVLNEKGTDVTPVNRARKGLFEVRFEFDETSPLVSNSDLWSNEC
ncbi:MAG: hypothetical protein U1E32_00515 [Rhodoglobus sp.]|nr:hypothetical protein [Rhodoglobus sp.]